MGRGARSRVRWHNDRVKAKKARDKRRGATTAETAPSTAPAAK